MCFEIVKGAYCGLSYSLTITKTMNTTTGTELRDFGKFEKQKFCR